MAMPNAFEVAEMQANHHKIELWKAKIEERIMSLIESDSQDNAMSFSCDEEDNIVIDKYIIPWLRNLRFYADRNHGYAGHDGDYNNLIIRW